MGRVSTEPKKIFGKTAAAVLRRPRVAMVWLVVVSLLSVLCALQLRVNPDMLALMPQDHPTTQAIVDLLDGDGAIELLSIAIDGARPEDVDAFQRDLIVRLEAMETVDFALYDIDEDVAWHIGLMQLSTKELGSIRDRLRGAINFGAAMANPFIAAQWLDLGPLTEKLKAGGQPSALASTDGTSRVLVRPTGSAQDTQFSRAFMADIYALLDEMEPERHGVSVAWVGGTYRHVVEDIEGIAHDLGWTAGLSLALVFVLIGTAFRDPRAILMIFGPLFIGNLWTLGFAGLTVGSLNTFTSFFSAVLIGLGVDFSIHLYSRYREIRAGGETLEDAVVMAWDKTGPPCAAAALTSAMGFLALWLADFKAFQQLGTLLAGGVLLCLVAVIVVLPLFIRWRDGDPKRAAPAPVRWSKVAKGNPTYRLAPMALMLVGIVSVAAATTVPRIEIEYDLSALRSSGLAYGDLSDKQRLLAEDSYLPVVVSYPDAESLAKDHVRISEAVQAGAIPQIQRVVSVHSVLPVDQAARVAGLQEIAALARHDNIRYLPGQVQQNLTRLAESTPSVMAVDDLPRALRGVLGADQDHHWMMVFASGNMWDLRAMEQLHMAIERWIPDRPAAGNYLALSVLYQLVRDDAPRIIGMALVFVGLVTILYLRNVGRGLGALGALVAGLCWAGAGLALFRVKLSMINFVGVPILMGIGIDVVIHLQHRIQEEGPGQLMKALATTGTASALSSATTILSFAALSAAGNQGIRSLGLMIVLGLALVTLAAFSAVPLGWMTRWKVSGQLESDEQRGGD
jgi:predicted exporter